MDVEVATDDGITRATRKEWFARYLVRARARRAAKRHRRPGDDCSGGFLKSRMGPLVAADNIRGLVANHARRVLLA
jgi:hypothetical protein